MNLAPTQERILKKRRRRDRYARAIITGFGFIVLLTMVVLIWHLFSQAATIVSEPHSVVQQEYASLPQANYIYVGDAHSGQPAVLLGPGCRITLAKIENQLLVSRQSIRRPCTHEMSVVSAYGEPYLIDISNAGLVRVAPIPARNYELQSDNKALTTDTEFSFSLPDALWPQQQGWQLSISKSWVVITVKTPSQRYVKWINRHNPTLASEHYLSADQNVVLLPDTQQLMLIKGNTLRFVSKENQPLHELTFDSPILWADTIVKNRSIFAALADGQLIKLSLFNQAGLLRYQQSVTTHLAPEEVPTALYAHASVNGLAMVTNQQRLLLINRLSGDIVEQFTLPFQPNAVTWFNTRVYVYSAQSFIMLNVENMAGLTTFGSLVSAQIYEGYEQPDRIWQSSSGSDFQETKLNLVPLLMGSFKASMLALFIAIPMALGAAIYTAYFARPRVRDAMKPTIEMLEAVPSVLIGFIAAIWLAPLAERFLYSLAVFIVILPVILLFIALAQHRLAQLLPPQLRLYAEVVFPIIGILLLGYVAIVWAPEWLFFVLNVDDFSFITNNVEVPVGKTTVLVAIALGFAISPSIYSLAEDAIGGVPQGLHQASYALGATRLQTLRRVVFKVAFPGVVAAIMLGFGRAFGETMIVLMVTGNTPIADWDLLAGLRALTANLAIELPEAKLDSIHYKVLFLTACILFVFTFIVNTFAELLRQRLRKVAIYV